MDFREFPAHEGRRIYPIDNPAPRECVGVKRYLFHAIGIQNTCKTTVNWSDTPYEQDLEHMPSLYPLRLYSLDTVFGQQGAEAQLGSSSILGRTSPSWLTAVRSE